MNNSQRVAVSVKDSTAKLIMGLLVDVGLPFEYRKAPGQTMAAVVSVAERNGPTLLKVREVIEDRQERAQLRNPVPDTPISSSQIKASAHRAGVQLFKETHKGFDLPTETRHHMPEPYMPKGYTLTCMGAGFAWAKDGGYGPSYETEAKAATSAWTHHFEHIATAQ